MSENCCLYRSKELKESMIYLTYPAPHPHMIRSFNEFPSLRQAVISFGGEPCMCS